MCVVMWHDCTLSWVALFALTPPSHPSTRSCTYARLLPNMGLTWRGLKWWAWRYILYMGGGGIWFAPSPLTGSCTHITICPHNIHNFKIKIQTYFEIIINANFLRLMFAYTTSNIYLTPRFKFWNLFIKFLWNCYLSMVEKKQCCWWPMITWYTVWFDYQLFVVHREIFEIYISNW